MTTKPLLALLSLAILMPGCNGRTSSPASPTPTSGPPVTLSGAVSEMTATGSIASHVLSGVVFEITAAGRVPIEGVEVYCDSCGSPDGHTSVDTDKNGSYSLGWATNGLHPLFVWKAGYEIRDPTGASRDMEGRIVATVDGDTRFDIELARR